ncbi:Transcriptional activator flo8 [Tulasnella sp. JGI-2019a]|nr:Transcriptional activator flo8 [Tulasnella sp. JGI-2019a]
MSQQAPPQTQQQQSQAPSQSSLNSAGTSSASTSQTTGATLSSSGATQAQPMHPTASNPGASASSTNSPQMSGMQNGGQRTLSWEGDRMLHIYMLDYARKRGFGAVVTALSTTTTTPTDVKAPIDAPQGLLYEWWVVFWEIFTAKSSEGANPDARTYLRVSPIHQQYSPLLGTSVSSLLMSAQSC